MKKASLSFLMGGAYSSPKNQVVLHAICDLISESYIPVFRGISPVSISITACRLLSKYGVTKSPTANVGECSLQIQELMDIMLEQKCFTKDELQNEIDRLFETVYAGDYLKYLGPF